MTRTWLYQQTLKSDILNRRVMMKKYVLCTIMILLFMLAPNLAAQDNDTGWITVKGESKIAVIPDLVNIDVTIRTLDKDLDAAKQMNDMKLLKLREVAELFSIPSENMEMVGLSFKPIYKDGWGGVNREGYEVIRVLTIRLDDIGQSEALLESIIATGVDQITRMDYGYSQRGKIEKRARDEALKQARSKADEMAEVLGRTVGKPLEVMEGGIRFKSINLPSIDLGSANIASREMVSASVTIKFELLD
jgi:uncharacterized protein YggE